jgi:hypothetical protein
MHYNIKLFLWIPATPKAQKQPRSRLLDAKLKPAAIIFGFFISFTHRNSLAVS